MLHDADMIAAADGWRTRDLDVLWHPCTQMREHPGVLPLVPIERGEGAWLVGRDGRRYLDAVSSWWTNLFGHAEPRIAQVAARYGDKLPRDPDDGDNEAGIDPGTTRRPSATPRRASPGPSPARRTPWSR